MGTISGTEFAADCAAATSGESEEPICVMVVTDGASVVPVLAAAADVNDGLNLPDPKAVRFSPVFAAAVACDAVCACGLPADANLFVSAPD